MKKNVIFNYLYRDDGNYKAYDSVIFQNPNRITLDLIREKIKDNLIDREFFIPKNWNIKKLSPTLIIFDDDEVWHEFDSVDETDNNSENMRSIDEFLELISTSLQ